MSMYSADFHDRLCVQIKLHENIGLGPQLVQLLLISERHRQSVGTGLLTDGANYESLRVLNHETATERIYVGHIEQEAK